VVVEVEVEEACVEDCACTVGTSVDFIVIFVDFCLNGGLVVGVAERECIVYSLHTPPLPLTLRGSQTNNKG